MDPGNSDASLGESLLGKKAEVARGTEPTTVAQGWMVEGLSCAQLYYQGPQAPGESSTGRALIELSRDPS